MNEFNTNKNKELLWNILVNGGKFNKLPQEFNTKQMFEKHVSQIEISSDMHSPLIILNKNFISSVIKEITIYTTSQQDLKKLHSDNFNTSLKEKEASFNDTIKLKTPQTIDFSDKNSDEPIGDIERLIEEQRSKRNLDIPKAPQNDERSVQEWLSGNSSVVPLPNPDVNHDVNHDSNFNPSKNITIGDTINNPQNTIIDIPSMQTSADGKNKKKNVKWQDNVSKQPLPNINDMFIKHEQIPINTKNIEAALVKILKNQDYIINAIHDLQDRI